MKKIEYFNTIKTTEELLNSRVHTMCIQALGLKKVSTDTLKEVIIVLYNELHKKIDKLRDQNRPYQIAIRFNRARQAEIKEYEENLKQISVLEYKTSELWKIIVLDEI